MPLHHLVIQRKEQPAMADEPTDPNAEPNDPAEAPEDTPADDPDAAVLAQADNPDAVKKALKAERDARKKAADEAKELAARLKEYEDRDKTEQQKMAERLSELEPKLSTLEVENLRLRVAAEKKLPPELVDRLRGEDRETLEADADELLALVATTRSPRGDADQGARQGGKNQLSRDALKNMTPEEVNEARRAGRLDRVLAGG